MKVAPFDIPHDELRRELDQLRHPFRIAIDRAKNPFNIGSIIRTAHSFLVKEIVLIGTEPWYERAAMGMHRYENLLELPDAPTFLEHAKCNNWKLVVFEKDVAQVGMWDADIPDDAVLVFGNEDDGVGPDICKEAHQVVGIPMYGINHSYPIAAAAAIGMAEWARRHAQGRNLSVPKKV